MGSAINTGVAGNYKELIKLFLGIFSFLGAFLGKFIVFGEVFGKESVTKKMKEYKRKTEEMKNAEEELQRKM